MPFIVGENIGPYRIVEQLGHGGMATVFKAYHAALDRYVAIKALHPAFTVEQNFLERFQREAKVVAKLEHPNIVPVYDYAEHEGRPYLVMKFIEGETLKARLAGGPLEAAELNRIVESVGAALAYAHKQGVLHRDIKPSNVLLTGDGRVYLADFGLARIAQAGESTISSDVMLGTPQYISPEQALGKRDLDDGTDIYSFGVLLYELLVGRVPYSADTPYSVIHDHIYTPLPMPRSIRGEIPEALERVLLKSMAKDRSDRYADINALLEAWRKAQAQAGDGVAVEPGAAPVVPAFPQPPSAVAVSPAAQAANPIPPVERTTPAATVVLDEAHLAAQSAAAAEQAEAAQGTSQAIPTAKSRSPWVWLAALLVLLCLCAAAVFVFAPRLRGRVLSALGLAQSPTATLVSAPVEQATQPQPPPTETPLPPPKDTSIPTPKPTQPQPTARPTMPRPGGTQWAPTAIPLEEAREHVAENPNDPVAHLELAVALLDAGQLADARTELNKAEELAGRAPGFYVTMGRQLAAYGHMLLAAEAFSKAVNLSPTPSQELLEALMQTMYLSASSPEFGRFLETAEFKRLEPVFVELCRARYHLYVKDDLETVNQMLKRLSQDEKTKYEMKLLEAEIVWKQGQKLEARMKLQTLSRDEDAPQWIRNVADILLRDLWR